MVAKPLNRSDRDEDQREPEAIRAECCPRSPVHQPKRKTLKLQMLAWSVGHMATTTVRTQVAACCGGAVPSGGSPGVIPLVVKSQGSGILTMVRECPISV